MYVIYVILLEVMKKTKRCTGVAEVHRSSTPAILFLVNKYTQRFAMYVNKHTKFEVC